MIFSRLNARDLIIGGKKSEQSRWFNEATQKYTGFDVEVIDYIMKKLGISYTVLLEESSTRLEHGWQDVRPYYDMVFTYSFKKERLKYLIYPSESHVNIEWNFFIRKEDEGKYTFNSYKDLKGLRIGFTKGQSYSDGFLDAISRNLFIIDEVVQDSLQIPKLLNYRIDAVPLSTSTTLYVAEKDGYRNKISYLPKPVKSEPYYNTFVKNSDYPDLMKIIPRYDRVLKQMKKDGTLKMIAEKYSK
ncbi:MAG: hypothetical protein A2015_13955 [Spirochaetes bacterium GWF1_31_7]|nr:MAG: hypothetical protein A2Y30_03795 [Spirochaetes bacterium GWE1_32_154]OHD48149.1 MAG: hypothetical protein A2Y29_10900 [Spirochaetes bacterium GWE2_31_10]OHD50624.1 MAG: hypothetical protein A2015_13955 [Spirochaetes bacterium GWF1_31_7]OHD82310.1 MAG: hypothetical protein A2355_11605 [Spirochaetes bacterium RIFOXYB1_FULL_32_8]